MGLDERHIGGCLGRFVFVEDSYCEVLYVLAMTS